MHWRRDGKCRLHRRASAAPWSASSLSWPMRSFASSSSAASCLTDTADMLEMKACYPEAYNDLVLSGSMRIGNADYKLKKSSSVMPPRPVPVEPWEEHDEHGGNLNELIDGANKTWGIAQNKRQISWGLTTTEDEQGDGKTK
ncbi:hypothetical protein EJB05_26443, partial [Eragrostis curvula]